MRYKRNDNKKNRGGSRKERIKKTEEIRSLYV